MELVFDGFSERLKKFFGFSLTERFSREKLFLFGLLSAWSGARRELLELLGREDGSRVVAVVPVAPLAVPLEVFFIGRKRPVLRSRFKMRVWSVESDCFTISF